MTMHFKDPSEKPVDVLHQLRLYHDPSTGTTQPKKVSKWCEVWYGVVRCGVVWCDAV